jgi:peptide/nickel transport system substrate-binding protein
LFAGTALIAAACGSSGGGGAANTTAAAPATTAAAPGTTAAAPGTSTPSTPGTTGAPAAGDAMTLTIHLNPAAKWDDGTNITSKDLECGWKAALNTPGSLSTVGYDQITSVDTSDPETAVAHFKTKYAPYKNLFSEAGGILEASKLKDCNDVSKDMQTDIGFSGGPWKLQSFSKDQLVMVPNDSYWDTANKPIAKKFVAVPKTDSDTELASLKSGEVGMIFPQAYAGLSDALKDPNIKYTPGYGTNYEGLYFQQLKGPFADATFRKAFSESVDRTKILNTIYAPIFPGAQLLQCGLWVPTIGKWCDNTQFTNSYNPTDAASMLQAAGWTKQGGMWAKDGKVPTIRWMVNTGNKRRADTQALMIPLLKQAGFNVVADNADAATVFQKRLPSLDYDLAMYINTAAPDPTVTSIMSCGQIPTAANGNKGQNSVGWCDQAATDLMAKSDAELDENARVDEIHQIGEALVKDAVMLPLYQFPNIVAWRTDKLGGPVDADAANYRGYANNVNKWQPVGGDTITIGAEQWPDCINPITDCANSSWQFWLGVVPFYPNVWVTTADGNYQTTSLVTGEPTVATP